jgi:hypothetical protein
VKDFIKEVIQLGGATEAKLIVDDKSPEIADLKTFFINTLIESGQTKDAPKILDSYKININTVNKVKGQVIRDSCNYNCNQYVRGEESLPKILGLMEGLPIY